MHFFVAGNGLGIFANANRLPLRKPGSNISTHGLPPAPFTHAQTHVCNASLPCHMQEPDRRAWPKMFSFPRRPERNLHWWRYRNPGDGHSVVSGPCTLTSFLGNSRPSFLETLHVGIYDVEVSGSTRAVANARQTPRSNGRCSRDWEAQRGFS